MKYAFPGPRRLRTLLLFNIIMCDWCILMHFADTRGNKFACVLVKLYAAHALNTNAKYTPPTRRNCRVASRQRRRCVHEFATSSRRLPTDSAMWTELLDTGTRIVSINLLVCLLNLQTKQTPCSLREFVYVNFYACIFITFSTVASLCCHLSAHEIANSVTTADECVHTADATQLDSFVASASAVCIRRSHSARSVSETRT